MAEAEKSGSIDPDNLVGKFALAAGAVVVGCGIAYCANIYAAHLFGVDVLSWFTGSGSEAVVTANASTTTATTTETAQAFASMAGGLPEGCHLHGTIPHCASHEASAINFAPHLFDS